ncbi:MAG: sensor histidine kinase [Thermoanaerobaculia bacterium]
MMKFLSGWPRTLFRTWPVALAALGGLLLLIWTSVSTTTRKAEDIITQLDQLNAHHREVEGKLRRLRSDIHLSGIYIRDYLLDNDRSAAPEYRQRLTEIRQSHSNTVSELRALLPPDFAPRLESLEKGLDEYWLAFEPLFDWNVVEKIVQSSRFLRREVLPRREAVMEIAREIEELNDANLAAQRAEVARRQAMFREDLHRRLRRAMIIGSIIALLAVLRLRYVERRSDQQRSRAEEAEREMRLLSQELVATQEAERKNITRELHDHVGQMLTALRMEIGRADRARGGPDAGAALAESKRLLETILRSVRDLVMGLRPSMLDDFGLRPALEWLVREHRRRFNIDVDLDLEGELDALPDQHRTCVYRIVQEALTNCARHASAKRIVVSAQFEKNVLQLRIADDGVGIDPRRARGMGLLGIEERVRELNGSFKVQARPQNGTELRVTLPVTTVIEEAEVAGTVG